MNLHTSSERYGATDREIEAYFTGYRTALKQMHDITCEMGYLNEQE